MGEIAEKRQEIVPAAASAYPNIASEYQAALKVVDDVILKNYITELSRLEIVPLSKSMLQSNIRDNVRFFKITEMAYEKLLASRWKCFPMLLQR